MESGTLSSTHMVIWRNRSKSQGMRWPKLTNNVRKLSDTEISLRFASLMFSPSLRVFSTAWRPSIQSGRRRLGLDLYFELLVLFLGTWVWTLFERYRHALSTGTQFFHEIGTNGDPEPNIVLFVEYFKILCSILNCYIFSILSRVTLESYKKKLQYLWCVHEPKMGEIGTQMVNKVPT